MSVKRSNVNFLSCDTCSNANSIFETGFKEKLGDLRRLANVDGWIRRRHDGKLLDLCKDCARVLRRVHVRGADLHDYY